MFFSSSLWRLPRVAQTFRGGINGSVTDVSGAAIPNAAVQAVNDATGLAHSTVSSSAGEYSFEDLPLGAYTVTVTASGFQTLKVDRVPVSAGSLYSLPLRVSVAAQATTVEVDAAGLALDTTTTTQTTVIPNRTVSDIPLNGRDYTQLIALTPGFSGYAGGANGSINGARANQMNWQIEGSDNNDQWWNIMAVNQGGVQSIAGRRAAAGCGGGVLAADAGRPGNRAQSRRHRQHGDQVRNQPVAWQRLLLQPQRSACRARRPSLPRAPRRTSCATSNTAFRPAAPSSGTTRSSLSLTKSRSS